MGTSIFSIGVSGLNAAQGALTVTSHNISNVNTAGYTRQVTQQAARYPQSASYGFIGQGVDLTHVNRVYDDYLTQQVQSAQATDSYYSGQLDFLKQVDSLMADSTVGVSPSLQDFFGSLQTLSADPSSLPSRQAAVNKAQALATKFRTLDGQLQEMASGVNTRIKASVDSINGLASQIADLNHRIAALTVKTASGTTTNAPNDLLDQRDQAILELNKQVKASVVPQSDGSYSVFIGNGQTLVLGSVANQLDTQPDPTNPQQLQLVYKSTNGSNTVIPTSLVQGGALGGILDFRDNALTNARTRLGNLAIDFAAAMNYQQQLGLDLNGQQGQPLFTDLSSYAANPQGAASALQVIMTDPSGLAAASNLKAGAQVVTSSGSVLSISKVYSTLPGDYGWSSASAAGAPNVTTHPSSNLTSLTIDSTAMTATVVNGAGTTTYNVVADPNVDNGYKLVSGSPAVDAGIAFSLSGPLTSGLTLSVVPNAAPIGKGDNTNLLAMAKLQTRPLVDDDRTDTTSTLTSFASHYASMVSYVGSVTNEATVSSTAQSNVLQEVQTARDRISAVNLDEEAANLIKYQQAYQASSKVIQIAQQIFSSLLQMN
ncbi:flagellar hook-associated protein FlgK [Pseudogulbenkiania subflava]|uniref:Flagellar hook-associated protein 1 n=1 Tax=Pseudogulbenkiania subflava DSM 22618 TaxID=1123014 RepID=A0A1Y6BLJ7_9NEIS|nr:flagellar hook-associated protein FlgK [Pseudogulbenkiania subflava]SMF16658.1 flagellar hook-associated protein 1 FlgK [Pseudogulbenkiania subflava DSM 22618]